MSFFYFLIRLVLLLLDVILKMILERIALMKYAFVNHVTQLEDYQ